MPHTRRKLTIGVKVTHFEKFKLRSAHRKVFHDAYDGGRGFAVRGTPVYISITGSLAGGHSDWKPIPGKAVVNTWKGCGKTL